MSVKLSKVSSDERSRVLVSEGVSVHRHPSVRVCRVVQVQQRMSVP